jgi:prefoldin beta subunit
VFTFSLTIWALIIDNHLNFSNWCFSRRQWPRDKEQVIPALLIGIIFIDRNSNMIRRAIMQNISPKIQNQLAMLQQVQQQLQTVLSQKNQYEMAVREAKRAQEEIKDAADDAPMYMSVGTVMVQKKKDAVNTKLSEKVETLELRIKSLEKQEAMLQGKFEQLQTQIKSALDGRSAPSAA